MVRILIVDDNPDALKTLGFLLTLEKHTVVLAATAGLALEAAASRPFDVVLLDIKMPGMDGFTLADRIGEMKLAQQPFLIALSGVTEADEGKLKKHGIGLFLTKPVPFDRLLNALKTLEPRN